MLAAHELEHRVERERDRLVEVLVEAEVSQPPGVQAIGVRELGLVPNGERQLGELERALDRELRDLAVSLARVAVAGRERARRRRGSADRAACPRTSSLQSMFPPEGARRGGRMDARPRAGACP